MYEYGIYSNEDGSLVMRGYHADTEEEALAEFISDYPRLSIDDYYASEMT